MSLESKIIVIGKPGCGKCLEPHTRILMADFGIKYVKDIAVGEEVYDPITGGGRMVVARVDGCESVMYRIDRACGGIPYIVTPNHRLVVYSADRRMLLIDAGAFFCFFKTRMKASPEACAATDVWWTKYIYGGRISISEMMKNPLAPKIVKFDELTISKYGGRRSNFTYVGLTLEPIPGLHSLLTLADGTITHNSTLLEDIVYNFRDKIPVCNVWCPTEDLNNRWKKIVPDAFIHSGVDTMSIRNSINRQKLVTKIKTKGGDDTTNRALYVFDDCAYDHKNLNNLGMQEVFRVGRHLGGLWVFSLQVMIDLLPALRGIADYVFIFANSKSEDRKKLYANFSANARSQREFNQLMDATTGDYKCLVIDSKTSKTEMSESAFWYKAAVHKYGFKFGCVRYRDWHRDRYDENYEMRSSCT